MSTTPTEDTAFGRRQKFAWNVIPAGFFIGLGVGLYVNRPGIGLLGLGIGLICSGILRLKYGFIIMGLIPALLGVVVIVFAPTMAYPYWVGLYIVLFGIGYLVKDRFETGRTPETGK